MEREDFFSLLVEQHNSIKDAVKETKATLEAARKEADEDRYEALASGMKTVKRLLLEHGEFEEEKLVPLLTKVYQGQAEMAHYVKDEHIHLEQELNALIRLIEEQRDGKNPKLDDQVYFKVKNYLDQMVIHIFEEESGMFPLLRGYLNNSQ